MILKSYKPLGGEHPETAMIKNVLAALGVNAPHTGKPFTEAMLFGVAGGLGIGYILWEFKKHASAILVMAFQNKWNYPVKFTANLCNRLGIKPVFKETGGTAAAEKHLKEALDHGIPAIAWVDQFHLPYMHLPETLNGCMGWIVTAYGLDEAENKVLIDDLGKKPLTLSRDEFAKARARIPSYYADFLTEACAVVNAPRLKEIAARYKKIAKMWANLADACLPDSVQPFRETKTLLVKKYELLRTQGDAGLKEVARVSKKLNDLASALNKQFPLSGHQINGLFADLQAQLYGIHAAEENALAELNDVVN